RVRQLLRSRRPDRVRALPRHHEPGDRQPRVLPRHQVRTRLLRLLGQHPALLQLQLRGWHFIALDSTSQYNQMGPGTAQYNWLKTDLAANTLACTLVMFHHPLFNVGEEGPTARVQPTWELMDQYGVDIA